jgi:large subunit ribosomal protein L22
MNNSLTATLKYALTSDKKLLLIAKLVKWKKVGEALEILKFLPKKGWEILYKVIHSASANATTNANMKADDLYISQIIVWKAPKIKRIRFTSRSRISHFVKSRAYVKVILDSK